MGVTDRVTTPVTGGVTDPVTTPPMLLPDCALPGCRQPVLAGDVCAGCAAEWGPYLARAGERPAWVPEHYELRHDTGRPSWVEPGMVVQTVTIGKHTITRWVKP